MTPMLTFAVSISMKSGSDQYLEEKEDEYTTNTTITVVAYDPDDTIKKFMEYVGELGGIGHGFGVEDKENDFETFWDGDGSDYIESITVNGKEWKSGEDYNF
jgi:hypothetical protein